MDAYRKRARTGGSASAEARLSALPDALIHTIMSFLKAHQVVQTCVLAKRWTHLWRSVPCLDIDLPEFNRTIQQDQPSIRARYDKFVDFADYLLVHRHQDGSLLDTFQLRTSYTHRAKPEETARWVRRGLKCFPRVFRFQNECDLGYGPEIPLELWSGPPHYCRLTKLHLLGMSLDRTFAEQITSVCDVLQELELKRCNIHFQKIASPSLRNLIIDSCEASNDQLNITAPRLASLHLDLRIEDLLGFVLLLLNEMSSLVKASIHKGVSSPADVVLLSSLSNVTSLELSAFHKRLLPDEEPVEFPTFQNLTTLLLDHCELGDKFLLLRHFLHNSPNLERLIVKRCKFSKGSRKGKGKAKTKISSQCQDAVPFSCWKLKYTKIIYEQSGNIGPLVNVLLDASDGLPKNTITLTKV